MSKNSLRRLLAVLMIPSMFTLACGDDDPTSPATPTIETIEVTPGSGTLTALGATATFTAVAFDEDGDEIEGIEFLWLSSDHGVATIASSGVATATGDGAAVITATAAGVAGEADVMVERSVSSVVVSPADSLFAIDATVDLVAEAVDAGGAPIPGVSFSWASSDETVATVDEDGRVAAVGDGTATITASVGIHSDATDVVVAQTAWPARSPVRLSRTNVPADDITSVEVAIQLRDRNGYPMVGRDVVLTLTGTGNTVVQPDPTDPDGATTASFRSNTGEIKSLSVVVPSIDGGPDVTLAQLEVRFNASQIVFTVQPAAANAIQQNVAAQVSLMDAVGNVVTTDTSGVSISAQAGAQLWGETTVVPTAGVAIFDSVSIDLAGTARLTASSGTLEAVVSDEFAVSSLYAPLATLLTLVSACDNCFQAIALAAPFEFFGVLYPHVNVASNGLTSMAGAGGASDNYINETIPTAADPNALLALFWDDLDPSVAGDVYYSSDAVSTAIEYRGVSFWGGVGFGRGSVTVEMRLFTGEDAVLALLPGDIVFIFHTLSHPDDASRALGSSATVGVENADGTAGTLISYNATQVVTNGRHLVLRYNGTSYDRIR
ncbi:MAG TPA: Ig-like domain-containing protein [Longimicrobiales bacterium]|nr:Ig-like domain-containing protein [Longimicrobiales bacterium]